MPAKLKSPRPSRSVKLSARLTVEERRQIRAAALAAGQWPSEWLRGLALQALQRGGTT